MYVACALSDICQIFSAALAQWESAPLVLRYGEVTSSILVGSILFGVKRVQLFVSGFLVERVRTRLRSIGRERAREALGSVSEISDVEFPKKGTHAQVLFACGCRKRFGKGPELSREWG